MLPSTTYSKTLTYMDDGWEAFVTTWRLIGQAAHRHLSDPGPSEDVLAAAINEAIARESEVL